LLTKHRAPFDAASHDLEIFSSTGTKQHKYLAVAFVERASLSLLEALFAFDYF
jgi:hypothetical protein